MDQIFGEMLMWDRKKETRKMHDCQIDGCVRNDSLFCMWCGLTEADLEATALEKSFVAAPCIREFGPHAHTVDHPVERCEQDMYYMEYGASDAYEASIDYSDWYGGEQGYRDGLRWSDFI